MRRYLATIVAVIALLAANGAQADETRLIMTTISSSASQVGQLNFHGWANRVTAAGKGVVSIDVRDGFALANSQNFYDRLLADVVQISFGSLNYIAGKFQLSQVMALPFVMDSAEQESVVFWRLYKTGLLDSEFDQIVPLYFYAFPQVALHLVKAPSAPLQNLSGLRIIVAGQIPSAMITRLGGTPISIGLSDTYEALQRGTADGLSFPMAPLPDFKLDEVTHYHILASLGGGPGGVWMAKVKYLGLPPAVRQILDENSGEAQSRRVGRVLDEFEVKVREQLAKEAGHTVATLSPAQAAQWKTEVSPMIDAWAGIDPAHAKVFAKVRELAADVKPGQ
ncbi:MAG TPA: TRAP transporter substrate-binding protein DctP [Stellaceae bacterium]|jgi:TRAP-type C4-dicarboxylate transport system substrate-binding protein